MGGGQQFQLLFSQKKNYFYMRLFSSGQWMQTMQAEIFLLVPVEFVLKVSECLILEKGVLQKSRILLDNWDNEGKTN